MCWKVEKVLEGVWFTIFSVVIEWKRKEKSAVCFVFFLVCFDAVSWARHGAKWEMKRKAWVWKGVVWLSW